MICYEFAFKLAVRKKNGRLYKSHSVNGIGITFQNALWDVYHTLKKRKSEILSINSVKAMRVAFAFDDNQQSLKLSLLDHPPQIPTDLSRELLMLPKKPAPEVAHQPIYFEDDQSDCFIVKKTYNDYGA